MSKCLNCDGEGTVDNPALGGWVVEDCSVCDGSGDAPKPAERPPDEMDWDAVTEHRFVVPEHNTQAKSGVLLVHESGATARCSQHRSYWNNKAQARQMLLHVLKHPTDEPDPAADLLREAAEVDIEWAGEVERYESKWAITSFRCLIDGRMAQVRKMRTAGEWTWHVGPSCSEAPTEADAWAALEAQLRLDVVLRRRAGR